MKRSLSNPTTYRVFAILLACLMTAVAVAGLRTSAASTASAAPPAPQGPGIYYIVTTTTDDADPTIDGGTGTSADPFQVSSLRGAVLSANTQITSVVGPITIRVPAGTYLLSVANPDTPAITGTTSFNDIEVGSAFNHETTVIGVGGTPRIEQTVPGNDVFTTGFADASYTPQAVKLTLQNLEITGGTFSGIFTGVDNATGKSDTFIVSCNVHGNSNFFFPFNQGGGIFNQTGNLTVQNSTFRNNSSGQQGGAIFYDLPNATGPGSTGNFSVSGSDFISNSAGSGAGFPGGGAISVAVVATGNTISITDSNFESNSTAGGSGGAVAIGGNNPVSVTLSRFFGNIAAGGGTAISNTGTTTINAINNWWGCDDFPGFAGCGTVSGAATTSPRIDLIVTSSPTAVCGGGTTTVTADFTKNSSGAPISPTSLDGETVSFSATNGSVFPPSAAISGAMASTTFTSSGGGTANVSATLDNGTDDVDIDSAADTTATDPADQTVCQGATATFSTTATGGDLHYAWTLDGSPFGGDTSSIMVDTTSLSLGVHTIGLTVTGTCGTVEHTATLTVNQAVSTTDPADATVCEGATANFSTTASGTGPFTYAWTVDGSPAGTNSPTLALNTTGFSFGNHTVEVTVSNACGSTSQSANLTVQENASTTDPADQTACKGAMANFSTTASGVGPFSYAWTVDGSPAGTNSPNLAVDTGSLTVGSHTVSVTVTAAACGSATQSATLTVDAPAATTDPADQSVCGGQTATFTTMASGTGPFSFVWKKGAMVLVDGDFGGRVDITSTATTSTLTITNAQPTDAGTYTVETTGGGVCNNTAVQSANLAVDNSPPVITTNGQTITMWPPNHKYSTFQINQFVTGASDTCDSGVDINDVYILSVSSDEPDDNPGGADGSTINDIVISADCKTVQLRAERDSNLNGRVYTITFKVVDSQGNVGTATAKVVVPVNNNGSPVIDSGVNHTVNSACP